MNTLNYLTAVFAVTAGMLCLAKPSPAQTAHSAIDTTKVYSLDELVVSASRYKERTSTTGRNVTVISRDEIENSVYSSLADLLSEQQSLQITGSRQTPGSLQQGFLRNANANQLVVMIDGVPLSDPSTVNNAVDLSEISLAGIQRIEIVRGSHSTLYGSSAIGGVINIISRKGGPQGFNVQVDSQQGVFRNKTYATTNNIFTNYSFANGFFIDASAAQKYSPGVDATIDTVTAPGVYNPQDRDSFNKLDLLTRAGYHGSSIDAYLSYRRAGQFSELDKGAYTDDDNTTSDFNRNLVEYGASYGFDKGTDIRFEGAYSNISRDFVDDSSLVNTAGNYDGTYTETNARGALWKNELIATLKKDYVHFIAGIGSKISTMSNRTYTYVRPYNYEAITDLDSLNLKETISSAFLHAEINAGFISQVLDFFSLNLGSRILKHNEFGSYSTYEINPKVRLSPSTLVYTAVTTGFNAPSLYQLYTPEKGYGAFTTRGNNRLKPEKSVSYEIGFKQNIGDKLRFNLSLFKTIVCDNITYVYLWNKNTAIKNLSGTDYLGDTYINIARQKVKGIEAALTVRPSSKFSYGGHISVMESTLSFNPADISRDYTGGNHVQVFKSGVFIDQKKELHGLSRRPKVSALIKANYHPIPKLGFAVSSRFTGARDDISYNPGLGPFGAQDLNRIKGYNLTDLTIHYKLSSKLAFTGKIENVFNTRYQEINGYQTQGRGLFIKASFRL